MRLIGQRAKAAVDVWDQIVNQHVLEGGEVEREATARTAGPGAAARRTLRPDARQMPPGGPGPGTPGM